MFLANKKDIFEYILPECNWRQACEWLETMWMPLPPNMEHFDKRRDNRIPIDRVHEHPSYWRRSQVLALAIETGKLKPKGVSDQVQENIDRLNKITNCPAQYPAFEISYCVRKLIHSHIKFVFDDLCKLFKQGDYTIIVDDTALMYENYHFYMQDNKLKLTANGETKTLHTFGTGALQEVVEYLLMKEPNTPKSYEELIHNGCIQLRNSQYDGGNLRKIRTNLIDNIKNQKHSFDKIEKIKPDELEELQKRFVYDDKKLAFYTNLDLKK